MASFGFALVSDSTDPTADVRVEYQVRGPLTLFAALFHTAVAAHDAHAMELPDIAARTIRIDDLGIPPTQFDLTQSQKVALYDAGQAAARDFLATWDFEQYKARFRSGALRFGANPGWHGPRRIGWRSDAEFVVVDHRDRISTNRLHGCGRLMAHGHLSCARLRPSGTERKCDRLP
jgi:hypothetical protein